MVRLTVEAELKDTFKNERWGHNLLLSLKVIWIVDNKCLSSFFLFNQRRHVFAQIRQRRRQRHRPTSILYLSLSLSANDHLMSCRLGLEEDQLESKTKWLIPSDCPLPWYKSTNNCLDGDWKSLPWKGVDHQRDLRRLVHVGPNIHDVLMLQSKVSEVSRLQKKISISSKSPRKGDMYLWWVENIQLLLGYHTLVHHIASGLLDIRLIRKEKW